jgi:hypothetical protein
MLWLRGGNRKGHLHELPAENAGLLDPLFNCLM